MTKFSPSRAGMWLQRPGSGRILAIIFLLCALPTGLGCALLTPIGAVSDEPAHLARADGLLTGQLTGVQPDPSKPAGVMMDVATCEVDLSEVFETLRQHPLSPATRAKAEAIGWTAQTIFYPNQMVNYFPVFYIPGAAGLAAGRAFGLTPLHAVFLGRVAMLLVFLALGSLALRRAEFGAPLIFATLTLPSTLHLAASYNQDGLIISSCALAVALLTRARPGPSPGWGAALALLMLVACAKTTYIVLYLACLAPLQGKGLGRRLAWVAMASLPPLAWLTHTLHGGFSPWHGPAYHPGPLWPGPQNVWFTTIEPAANIHVLLAHPSAILTLPFTSLPRQWIVIWPLMLAQIGWDLGRFPAWMYGGLYLSTGMALLGAMLARPPGWRLTDAALILAVMAGAFMSIELSLYVTWVRAGAESIYGVTGRYFLPLLPLLIFVLPTLGQGLRRLPSAARLKPLEESWFALPAIAMAMVNIVAVPAFIYHIYQMPGP